MGSAYLPEEIVEKIAKEHLSTFPQLAAFSAVCRSWRSIAHNLYDLRRSFPGILVSKTSCHRTNCCEPEPNPDCASPNSHHQFRPISSIFNSTRSRFLIPPLLRSSNDCRTTTRMHLGNRGGGGEAKQSEPSSAAVDLENCHCVASKDGWLVLLQPRPVRIYLLNPITGASILLPPLQQKGYRNLSHVILSSSPEKNDCHVIVLSSSCTNDTPQVAWCKVSDGCWKSTRKDSKFFAFVLCAAYIRGNLYVVDGSKSVHVFDNLMTAPSVQSVQSLTLPYLGSAAGRAWTRYYAMELNRQLIIVVVHYYQGDVVTFRVHRLERDNVNWTEISSLDGHAMFLGSHQAFCIPVQEDGMIRSDHVYYLNNSCGQCVLEDAHCDGDYWYGLNIDWGVCGVFNLEDRKLVEHSRFPFNIFQDYIWFLPVPWDVHKHLNKKKNKKTAWKSKEHQKIDDNGLELCSSSSKVTDHNPQQLASNRITPCHNSFEALLLVD